MYLWTSLFVIILIRIVLSKIITLSKENVIICVVTRTYNYSTLHIDPPVDVKETLNTAPIQNREYKCKGKHYTNVNYDHFQNKPGYLDEQFNLTCSEVLGINYPFCDKYKICIGNHCECAWGYEKPACTQICKNGYWGFSCLRKCDLDCEVCDPKKGCICKKQVALQPIDGCYNKLHDQIIFQRIFITMLGLFPLVIGVAVIITLYKKKKKSNTNIESIPLTKITIDDEKNKDMQTNTFEQSFKMEKKVSPLVSNIEKNYFENTVIDKIKNKQIEEEFLAIPHVTKKTTNIALEKININKNKDNKHLPYDQNRVILKDMEGVGKGDYINASYINGYNRPKTYIACPGPKFYTIKDFWRMIWQEQVETIIMASNFIEKQNRMSAEYFPQKLNGMFECGSIIILLTKEENSECYIKRTVEVRYNDCERIIQHFQLKKQHFFSSNNLLPIVKKMRTNYKTSSAPILIHSGFGANRTGTLILCDLAIQMLELENKVNFYELAKNLREQRFGTVNQLDHYILAHLVVLEYLMEEQFPFETNAEENVQIAVTNQRQKLERQLKYVEKLHEHDKILQSFGQKTHFLNCPTNFVHGYEISKKYIITPKPKGNLNAKFWLMVAHESTSCVLFLNKLEQNVRPFREETRNFVINIQILNRTDTPYYILSKIALLIYGKQSKIVTCKKNVSFYEYKNHPKRSPTVNILKLICDIKKHNQIIIPSSDGVETIGIFLVLSYVIRKYETEMAIDVCNAIRTVRQSDVRFVNTLKTLEFIYTCISEYLRNFEDYNIIDT
ncbi:receptor-type tyrosine-protein phosphatase epsilon-like isoform X2 [Tribolium madens]|uniref:receptor-type tyrosine-protein phosphatase epsilon-like isoform X2 n=1 Tax=Tribolium madens TaxID=41895 RepID=UPI001CF72962|nr:receptor-type tyrosine-protein phosphatase epsilon-like isoform X2 [Tribolium madens]